MHDLSLFTSGFARSNDFYLQYAAYRVLHAVSQFKKRVAIQFLMILRLVYKPITVTIVISKINHS